METNWTNPELYLRTSLEHDGEDEMWSELVQSQPSSSIQIKLIFKCKLKRFLQRRQRTTTIANAKSLYFTRRPYYNIKKKYSNQAKEISITTIFKQKTPVNT